MAAGKLNMQKASGGVASITIADGVTNTEVTLPESGTVVSVGTTVTDNAIARYDGITGKLQNSGVTIDDNGNLLITLGTGGLGYGTGSGGTVTQLTSKSTAVTLNKPTGRVVTNNAPLADGAIIQFRLNNSLINITDTVYVCTAETGPALSAYDFRTMISNGYCYIYIANQSGITLSDAIGLNFTVIKGATA